MLRGPASGHLAMRIAVSTLNSASKTGGDLRHPLNTVALNGVLAVVYFAVARLSLLVVHPDLKVTAIWLPSGLALAAVLLLGRRMLPGILAGDLCAGLVFGSTASTAIVVAVAGAIEAVLGAHLMSAARHVARGHAPVTMLEVTRYVFRGALLAPLASSTIGTGALVLAGTVSLADVPRAVAMWWTGDVVGILLVMPLVLALLLRPATGASRITGGVLVAVALGVAAWVFLRPGAADTRSHALALLVFPPLVWSALTGSGAVLAAGNLGVALIAIWGTALGLGPYATADNATDVWYLQAFIVAFTVTTLLLRGAIEDQRRLHWRAAEMERHFAAAADHGMHALLILSPPREPTPTASFRIAYANARARALCRVAVAPHDHPLLQHAIPELGSDEWRARFEQILRLRAVVESEVAISPRDGIRSWFRCTGIPLDDGLMVTLLDITDRLQAEQALHVSEQRYRLAAVGGHVWDWDIETQRISIVPEWWQRLGWLPPDPSEMIARFEALLHPADLPRWRGALREHLARRTPYNLEFRARDHDGDWHWFHTQGQAIWRADGRANYMAGTNFDITDRKRAEDALRSSEAYRRNLFEQLGDGVFLFDRAWHVVDANPRAIEMLGYTRTELLDKRLTELVAPFESDRLGGALPAASASTATTSEWVCVKRNGDHFPAEVNVRNLDDDRHLAVVRDVTERRNTERSLFAYQSELSELTQRLLVQEKETTQRVAQALHDQLGQTLAAARLRIDAALSARPNDAGAPNENLLRVASLIEQAVGEVRVMLVDLRPPLLEDEGLGAALDNEIHGRFVAGKGADVALELEGSAAGQRWPPDVEYGAFMVAREAIGNALMHANASAILVRLSGDDGSLRLEIIDDGVGIPMPMVTGRPGHLGIVGMRERAIAIGARLHIERSTPTGTRVALRWEAEER